MKLNSQFRLYFICSFVSLGGFMYRYDSGVIITIMDMPSFQEVYSLKTGTPAYTAVLPVSLAASSVASFMAGLVADILGRKRLFWVAAILHFIGCITELADQNYASFFTGRILNGFSEGVFSMLIPLYQSEIAKPNNRGRLITLYQIFVTLGFCISFWLSFGTFQIKSHQSWKIPLATQLIPSGIMLLGIYFIPESPRWLIYKERNAEALSILAYLRSRGNQQDAQVQMEFTGIVQDVSFDKMVYKQKFWSLLDKGNDNNRKRTLLGIGIHVFTQLSGINAILFYLPYILQSAGIYEIYSILLGNGAGGAVNFIATVLVLFYIDRWGRRKILIVGGLAMGSCMVAITIISAIFNQQLINNVPGYGSEDRITEDEFTIESSFVVLALICVFIAFFAFSWGPIGWLYPAEIYPQMIRANAMGVTTSFSYLSNLLISVVSPIMFRDIVWGTYIFFAVMCFSMAIIVHLFYPETRGRSLEEIQLIFSGALIDQRPDAHHPATAAEALILLEQIQHQNKRDRMARDSHYPVNAPGEWSDNLEVSSPHNVTRVLNNRTSHDTVGAVSHLQPIIRPPSSSSSSSLQTRRSSSSIELSLRSSKRRNSDTSQV
ncbi:hypothetical protein BD770DRAFT_390764 [Pilaira anomala]|nr:hypothetical protein BD770DRAFT_390764 [Pilaira anomala]